MVDKEIKPHITKITSLISDERINGGKVYWWILMDARVGFIRQGKRLYIKLPLPELKDVSLRGYRAKKYNEQEIERVKKIYEDFIVILQEKLEKVDSGQSTVEEEFKSGILLEDGKYGLKYGKGWYIGD